MNQIKVGVIGCGYWGPNLVRNLMEMPTSRVAAVADLSEERLAQLQKTYPQIQVTRDYRDLLTMGLDAVVVATPPASHYAISRDCLEAGLHVLVEKPITLSSADAEALVTLAEARKLTLMVGHTFEYNEAVRVARRVVQEGSLGDIYYINAVRANLGPVRPGLNALWDLAPHDISILRYLLGAGPVSVSAQGAAYLFQGKHDVAFLHLVFPNNVVAHVHVSWLDPCKVRRLTVVGSKKMLVYDDVEPLEKLRIYDKGVDPLPYTNTFGEYTCSYRYGDVTIPSIAYVEPLRAECEHFVQCVLDGTRPLSSGRDGLDVVRVLEAAEASLLNGGGQHPILAPARRDEVALPHPVPVLEPAVATR